VIMRWKLLFLILAVLWACDKDNDPKKFNSFNGYWTVTTPDAATTVTFKIGVDSNNAPAIESATVHHNGSDYTNEPIDTELIMTSATAIESITFRTTQFVIRLEGVTTSTDFREMYIAHSYFTIDSVIETYLGLTATRP
jgi:hypothetical protein